ncbi:MAG: hypothetical protein IJN83_02195 [Clostridia bacterium]|nr:hypothetical protein [Clostridia bacterium]
MIKTGNYIMVWIVCPAFPQEKASLKGRRAGIDKNPVRFVLCEETDRRTILRDTSQRQKNRCFEYTKSPIFMGLFG